MSKKWYGSINNRLEENHMFCDEIKVGTGMTEYSYTDRHAYEVVAVKDQKHVSVRKLDHKLVGDAYSNNWELISNEANPVRDMVKRGDYWYYTVTVTADYIGGESIHLPENFDKRLNLVLAGFDIDKILAKGKQTKLSKANVSFGIADYYYDYSF